MKATSLLVGHKNKNTKTKALPAALKMSKQQVNQMEDVSVKPSFKESFNLSEASKTTNRLLDEDISQKE